MRLGLGWVSGICGSGPRLPVLEAREQRERELARVQVVEVGALDRASAGVLVVSREDEVLVAAQVVHVQLVCHVELPAHGMVVVEYLRKAMYVVYPGENSAPPVEVSCSPRAVAPAPIVKPLIQVSVNV